MTVEEKPTSITETIEAQFNDLVFSRSLGNEHYRAGTKVELEARNQRVETFLTDDTIKDPELTPKVYDYQAIEATAAKYDTMLAILIQQPDRTPKEEVLIDTIIDKTGELFRYEELLLAMGSVAVGDRDRHEHLASDLSLEIMGGVNRAVFSTLLNEVMDLADVSSSQYATELKTLIHRQPETGDVFDSIELETRTREMIGKDLGVLFPGLDELIAEGGDNPISPEEALPIFKKMATIVKLGDGWNVSLDNSKAADTSDTGTTIGRNRPDFKNHLDAVAVAFHEEGVHGGRSKGQSESSHDFEEGLATRLQQVISGQERTPGAQYYFSIGIQAGTDQGDTLRNYRDSFEILWRREALVMEKAGKELDITEARYRAQRQLQRTRRGGAIDTYDAAYFVGAQKAAEWLNQIAELPDFERRQKLLKVLLNRYDPTIPEQVARIGMG